MLLFVVGFAGCSRDERVVQVAREAADRQAEQNLQMADLQKQVAEGSRRLVEAEAKTRGEMTAMQRELQQSQAEVGRQTKPCDDQWTGAEIRACCRLAALLDVPLTSAAQNVVPVAVTAAESVDRLRQWASGRCLSRRPEVLRHRWL